MKTLGIQIKSNEVILVVLLKDANGNIIQLPESTKFKLEDPSDNIQVRQFRDQVNTAFDSIAPDRIGILARNPNAKANPKAKIRPPSPISFKLEGIIQLYERYPIDFIWPTSISSFFKKHKTSINPDKKYEENAFKVAYHLIHN